MEISISCLVKIPTREVLNVRNATGIEEAKRAAIDYWNDTPNPYKTSVTEDLFTDLEREKADQMDRLNLSVIQVFIYQVIISDDRMTIRLPYNEKWAIIPYDNIELAIECEDGRERELVTDKVLRITAHDVSGKESPKKEPETATERILSDASNAVSHLVDTLKSKEITNEIIKLKMNAMRYQKPNQSTNGDGE
jgi:hypothetical protein